MALHKFKISGEGPVGEGYKVEMDGRQLLGVNEVSVHMGLREINEVTITFMSDDLDVQLEGQVSQVPVYEDDDDDDEEDDD